MLVEIIIVICSAYMYIAFLSVSKLAQSVLLYILLQPADLRHPSAARARNVRGSSPASNWMLIMTRCRLRLSDTTIAGLVKLANRSGRDRKPECQN